MFYIREAYDLYQKHIYDKDKMALLKSHGFSIPGVVPAVMWELFGSILTGCSRAGNTGADLNGWEVKSAKEGCSFEYQYHLHSGRDKLLEDCTVKHLYCSYSPDYANVTVRYISGSSLAPYFFNKWLPEYDENYDVTLPNNQRRQRFRRAIPFGHVVANGTLVLVIRDGVLVP